MTEIEAFIEELYAKAIFDIHFEVIRMETRNYGRLYAASMDLRGKPLWPMPEIKFEQTWGPSFRM